MTRYEAVEEGEKTHTELVLAGRQGAQRKAASAHGGPAACLLGLWDGAMGHVVGAEQKVRDSTQRRQRDVRSRRHAGEPEGEKGGPDGRKQCSQALACSYAEGFSRVVRRIRLPLGLTPCSPGAAAIECPVWLEVAPPYPCPVLRTVAFPAFSAPADHHPPFP